MNGISETEEKEDETSFSRKRRHNVLYIESDSDEQEKPHKRAAKDEKWMEEECTLLDLETIDSDKEDHRNLRSQTKETHYISSDSAENSADDAHFPKKKKKKADSDDDEYIDREEAEEEDDEEEEFDEEELHRRRRRRGKDVYYGSSDTDFLYQEEPIEKPKKKKKKAKVQSDEEEDSSSISSMNNGEKPVYRIEKILTEKTQTAEAWKHECANMNTYYLSRGSIFISEETENEDIIDSIPEEQTIEPEAHEPEQRHFHKEVKGNDTRYFVKWQGLSYIHCSWEKATNIIQNEGKIGKQKIEKFYERLHDPFNEICRANESGDYFNPEYCQVDRILDVSEHYDEEAKELYTNYFSDHPNRNTALLEIPSCFKEYYVKWKGLPYDESTFECEYDITDNEPIQRYENRLKCILPLPPKKERNAKRFKMYTKLKEPKKYKNGNTLRSYQIEGLDWLLFNWHHRRGSLLADEMGLGKTVQVVTFVEHLINVENHIGPYLIIAPLSTLGHWQREFETWTDLNAVIFHGNKESRQLIKQYEFYYDNTKRRHRFDVLIVSFTGAVDYQCVLSKIKWQCVIIDEAHKLKNRSTQLYHVVYKSIQYEDCVLLTGTPIQNNLEELWVLMTVIDREQFSNREKFLSTLDETKESVDELHTMLKPYILRRLKEHAEKSILPKEEIIIDVELTPAQKQYYRAIYEKNYVVFVSKSQRQDDARVRQMFNVAIELRKCCNHPFLLDGCERNEIEQYLKAKGEKKRRSREISTEELNNLLVRTSGKFIFLDKLLPRLQENQHRILLFSQYKLVLNIVEDYLTYRKYSYVRIDGDVTGSTRQSLIDRFNSNQEIFIMLLTTKCGGVGINLTGADTVIIYDSDWNPQNDIQAQARCHRIGQEKAVKIYRLLTSKTYEYQMFHVASMKLGLGEAVLGNLNPEDSLGVLKKRKKKKKDTKMNKQEIENLLKYGAYELFKDDAVNDEGTCIASEETLDQILSRSTKIVHSSIETPTSMNKGFSRVTFIDKEETSNIVDLNDPDFWEKTIGNEELSKRLEETKEESLERLRKRHKGRVQYYEGDVEALRVEADDDEEYQDSETSETTENSEMLDTADFENIENITKETILKEALSKGTSSKKTIPKEKIPKSRLNIVLKHMSVQCEKRTKHIEEYLPFHSLIASALLTYGYGNVAEIHGSHPELGKIHMEHLRNYIMTFLCCLMELLASEDRSSYGFYFMWPIVLKHPLLQTLLINIAAQLTLNAPPKMISKGHQTLLRLAGIPPIPSVDPQRCFLSRKSLFLNSAMLKLLDKSPRLVLQAYLDELDLLYRVRLFTSAYRPFEATLQYLSGTMKKEDEKYAYAEQLMEVTRSLPSLPTVPEWCDKTDDLRLLLGISKHGYSKIQSDISILLEDNELNLKRTLDLSFIKSRLDAMASQWMSIRADNVTNKLTLLDLVAATRPQKSTPSKTKKSSDTPPPEDVFNTIRGQRKLVKCVLAHGIPRDVKSTEGWLFFLSEPLFSGVSITTLEQECTDLVLAAQIHCGATSAPLPPKWVDLEKTTCVDLMQRVACFQALRSVILPLQLDELKKLLTEVMEHAKEDFSSMQNVPDWWRSPDHDLAMLQGSEHFGFDDGTQYIWRIRQFSDCVDKSLPSPSWVFLRTLWIVHMLLKRIKGINTPIVSLCTEYPHSILNK